MCFVLDISVKKETEEKKKTFLDYSSKITVTIFQYPCPGAGNLFSEF